MIKPTVGRVVWFRGTTDAPLLAAIIAFVHSDRLVNLMVIAEGGIPFPASSVDLVQEGDAIPDGRYCEWMPYQKGQAAKTEALEAAAGGAQ